MKEPPETDNGARRKVELTRLRARLKYAIGAYHLLEHPEASEVPMVDGMTPIQLRRWTDAVIDNLRGRKDLQFMLLTNLAASATERNRLIVQVGTNPEAVIYQPNYGLLVEAYEYQDEQAIKILSDAVDVAIREWLAVKGAPNGR